MSLRLPGWEGEVAAMRPPFVIKYAVLAERLYHPVEDLRADTGQADETAAAAQVRGGERAGDGIGSVATTDALRIHRIVTGQAVISAILGGGGAAGA